MTDSFNDLFFKIHFHILHIQVYVMEFCERNNDTLVILVQLLESESISENALFICCLEMYLHSKPELMKLRLNHYF